MTQFNVHTKESAPSGSREALIEVERSLGFVPNLMGVLAEAPAALKAYLDLSELFESCSLTPVERQVVLLAVSFENECDYCMAAHSGIARMQGVSDSVVAALRDSSPITDPKLEALRRFASSMAQRRAALSQKEVDVFLDAGYSRQQLLEVVLGVTQKTLSNYVNHMAHTPLDEAFAGERWSRPEAP